MSTRNSTGAGRHTATPAEVADAGRQSSTRTPAADAGRQSSTRTPAADAGRQSNSNRTPSKQESRQPSRNGASQASLRDDEEHIPQFEDTPRSLSVHDRELINKSRNGFVGTVYISDVKQYFEHPSFDGNVLETNKRYLEDLLSDFRKLLRITLDDKNDTLHDVEFVEDENAESALPGHRQLLTARSATFEALFKRLDNRETEYLGFRRLPNADEDSRVIRLLLPQEGPRLTWDLMEASLHYMYWGNIEERLITQEDRLKEFFEVASFLDLKELRRHLASELFNNLKAKGIPRLAIEYLKLSVKCGCKYLKKEVIGYIVRFKAYVLKDPSWTKFVAEKDNKDLVKEIYQAMVEKSNE